MAVRNYSSVATKALLAVAATTTDNQLAVTATTGWPTPPFTLILDRNLATEEVVTCTTVNALFATVARGQDGTTAQAHSAGATVEHGVSARDFTEANTHLNTGTGVHGLTGTVVGTTDTQTLDNKTLSSLAIPGSAGNSFTVGTDGAFNRLPRPGNTATRPSTAPEGAVRWNTDASALEIYRSGTWQNTVASSNPIGRVWAQGSIATNQWTAVCFGATFFVAVGETNEAAVSSNAAGTNFTVYAMGLSGRWTGIAYGNSTFVAIAAGGTLAATSPDGITWTARTLPVTAEWAAITYGNSTFVAIARNGTVAATSPDGITWTARTLPFSGDWTAITYGNKFVACAAGVAFFGYSTDGITWSTSAASPGAYAWTSIAYKPTGTIYVAIAEGSATVARSTDGNIWTSATHNSGGGDWSTIVYSPAYSAFKMFARRSTSWSYSTDGTTWTASATALQYPGPITCGAASGTYDILLFNGFTSTGYAGYYSVSVSNNNGQVVVAAQLTAVAGLAYGAGQYVAVGDNQGIVTSSDGLTWTRQKSAFTSVVGGNLSCVLYAGGQFVAGATNNNMIETSPDGVTWTARPLAGGAWSVALLGYGAGLYVAIPPSGTSFATSPDAVTWTLRSMPALNATPTSIAYGNGRFVVTTSASGWATSTDGINWTVSVITHAGGQPGGVTYGNGMFVAWPTGGTQFYTSVDGSSWTRRTHGNYIGTNNAMTYAGCAYAGGQFVLWGYVNDNSSPNNWYGYVWTSSDAVTWSRHALPVSSNSANNLNTPPSGNAVAVGAPRVVYFNNGLISTVNV